MSEDGPGTGQDDSTKWLRDCPRRRFVTGISVVVVAVVITISISITIMIIIIIVIITVTP